MRNAVYKIDENDYNNVIEYFNNNHDNRTSIIAKKLKLKKVYVSYIIDLFLSKKRNYMGANIRQSKPKNEYHLNSIPLEIYEDEKFIGKFNSIKDAAEFIGLKNSSWISKNLIDTDIAIINHYAIKKKYTYVKI